MTVGAACERGTQGRSKQHHEAGPPVAALENRSDWVCLAVHGGHYAMPWGQGLDAPIAVDGRLGYPARLGYRRARTRRRSHEGLSKTDPSEGELNS